MKARFNRTAAVCGLIALAMASPLTPAAAASRESLKREDSFRVGTTGVLCTAQSQGTGPLLASMFDRGYALVCRDAATQIGSLYALRSAAGSGARAVLDRLAVEAGGCTATENTSLDGLAVTRTSCVGTVPGVPRLILSTQSGGTLYIAEGLAGYEPALSLGLQSLVADRAVPGEVAVTVTGTTDPTALARVQAGVLDPEAALSEGYLRNNAGSFAEAAAFFENLVERSRTGDTGFARTAEYLANQGLQQSNLGKRAAALDLFERAARAPDAVDPIQQRRLRNFRAIDALNNFQVDAALEILATPVSAVSAGGLDPEQLAQGVIARGVSQRLNTDAGQLARLAGGEQRLSTEERIEILDAQSEYLRGVAYRAGGRLAEAKQALNNAIAAIDGIRGGRVRSLGWLNAASYTDLGAIAEAEGDAAGARAQLSEAVRLLALEYPGSASLLAAEARLAALYARQGDAAAARSAFAAVVKAAPTTPGGDQAIRPIIGPYFALLAQSGSSEDAAAFFAAAQTLVRPGVAQTQAVLARELSGGSDEAAALFRESSTVSREVVRVETEIGRLTRATELTPDESDRLQTLTAERETLATQQTQLLARLAAYPRYRVVSPDTLPLSELQAALKPAEAYYKLSLIGGRAYGMMITADMARVVAVPASTRDLEAMVARLRDSIVRIEDGQTATYPFDAPTARLLYQALFTGLDEALADVRHIIFEPDGPLLQLPPNLLITSDAGLPEYLARVADITADAYDMRGIAWLGRDRMVTTAVSARSFVDLRRIAPSSATRAYLGLGQNAAPPARMSAIPRDACEWPLAAWTNPIAATELRTAAAALGSGSSEILTDAAFADTALNGRDDLRNFRVLHFATHGLVTAPSPQCSAQPALLTSFGTDGSDGLLTFKEIFDLRLDAETVILSACDTAGMATVSATREAGIATGGNFALDGLVRAFVGAGSRTVIASHWPVPDDFGATERLISGLFDGKATRIGESMRQAAVTLMDDAATSHPYYWSAFAIVGDGERPLQ
ncbi:MAG: CHAT domain-containing protein [Polymorphobacter sp.]|uniref:CHAT domain-containing protein n=1 Tax=Polymorphobacter sp. TaxID=1909290 RepID=UPI003A8A1B51